MASRPMVSWDHEGDWKSGAIGSEINDTDPDPMISLRGGLGFICDPLQSTVKPQVWAAVSI